MIIQKRLSARFYEYGASIMQHKRTIIYVFTFFLLVIVIFFTREEQDETQKGLCSITLSSVSGEEQLSYWENADGDIYIFLPSFVDLSQVQITFNPQRKVSVDGVLVEEQLFCQQLLLNSPYMLSYLEENTVGQKKLTLMQSENVPAMFIDVRSGSVDYIHQEKENAESGSIRLYTADGEIDYRGIVESIHGRGNSTWLDQSKKAYSLKLESKANMLGMCKSENWVLLANAFDATHLRNKLVYDFSASLGLDYSPECQWVDLYLNGSYAGLYLLCERNEVSDQRIALKNGTGYVVSTDIGWRLENKGVPFFTTNSGVALRIHYSSVTESVLKDRLQSVENAIYASDSIDAVTGKKLGDLIDINSWVKKFLVEEFFGNVDAGDLSQFFYSQSEHEKIYAGPVWDFDLSMGNINYNRLMSPYAFYAAKPQTLLEDDISWYYNLYKKDQFYSQVVSVYRNEFLPLITDYRNVQIDQYSDFIEKAAKMNQIRWSTPDFCQAVSSLSSFLQERMEFLNRVWLFEEEYYTVLVYFSGTAYAELYVVFPGEFVTPLLDYEEMLGKQNWYIYDSNELFDINQPIYENIIIYQKS